MSNFLTGDFDAVVQVSRGTVNRLLATTHQNRQGYSKKMPLSPQKLVSRIGSYESVTVGEGQVHGTAWVQISVPTIEIESPDLIIACLRNPFHANFHTFQRFLNPCRKFLK
jgi:hypothetical protein